LAERIGREVQIKHRNLAESSFPAITGDYAESVLLPLEEAQKRFGSALSASDELVSEVVDSDMIWISTPVHNFTVPAILKNWIDLIVRRDVTFTYTDKGKVGLLKDRPTFVAVTSGGAMFEDPPRQPDFFRPYLRAVLGIIGLKDVTFVPATELAFSNKPFATVEAKADNWLSSFDGVDNV